MMYVVIFLFGLIFGSFLNAVIYRLHVGESWVHGRSKCVKCKKVLGTWDLIPILSWLYLRGRCRYCQKKISWQYPLVELATAVAFVAAYSVAGVELGLAQAWLQAVTWMIYALFLIIIFVFDWKYYLILDAVIYPAAVMAFILNLFLGVSWSSMLLAAIIGAGFFWLQYILSRGTWIGAGDIRLGGLMGLMLGWPGILVALFIAYVVGSIVGIILIIAGRKKWGQQIPFGTFLSLATFVILLYGQPILQWYLNYLGI
ncbi:MAG: prepilin peptidase [Candidatus Komeilibacteria bacterium]